MLNEEEKAIKKIQEFRDYYAREDIHRENYSSDENYQKSLNELRALKKQFDIVLNLITKLQKENEYIHKELDKQQTIINNYAKEKEEKDKQIDLMALALSNICTGIPSIIEQFEKEYCEFINSNEDCCWKTDKNCQDCIKQYFEKQAKEKGD